MLTRCQGLNDEFSLCFLTYFFSSHSTIRGIIFSSFYKWHPRSLSKFGLTPEFMIFHLMLWCSPKMTFPGIDSWCQIIYPSHQKHRQELILAFAGGPFCPWLWAQVVSLVLIIREWGLGTHHMHRTSSPGFSSLTVLLLHWVTDVDRIDWWRNIVRMTFMTCLRDPGKTWVLGSLLMYKDISIASITEPLWRIATCFLIVWSRLWWSWK